MYKKLLIAVDGSRHDMVAAATARDLCADRYGHEVTLLHIEASERFGDRHSGHAPLSGTEAAKRELRREGFDPALSILRRAGIPASLEILDGRVGEEICRFAREGSYELVILGRRGIDEVQERLLGSTSEYVIRHSHLPVLIVQ